MRQIWRGAWASLRNGLAPMLGKEMRGRTRGWRAPVLLTVYLGLLTAGVEAFLWLGLERTPYIAPQVGLNLYGVFIFVLVLLLSFIAPAVAAGAISGERERRTYDLILVTKASLGGIVLGKWLAAVAYLLFLVLAALPVLAVVFLFGGVPLATLGTALVVSLATGLGYGALGLALSALLRRSQAATVVALVLVFTLVFGSLVVGGVAAAGRMGSGPVPPGGPRPAGASWYVYLSPLTALTSVMPGGQGMYPGQGIPLLGTIINDLFRQLQMGPEAMAYAYKMGYAGGMYPGAPGAPPKPTGLAAWAPWARFALNQGILTVVCLFIAILAITPLRPWRAWRYRGKVLKPAG